MIRLQGPYSQLYARHGRLRKRHDENGLAHIDPRTWRMAWLSLLWLSLGSSIAEIRHHRQCGSLRLGSRGADNGHQSRPLGHSWG